MMPRNSSIIDDEDTIAEYKYFESNIASIECPNARTIANHSFYACKELKEIDFPELMSISTASFENCTSLKVGYFPKASSISSSAFNSCASLKEANFPELVSIGVAAFKNCTSLKVAYFPKATSIGLSAFSGCRNLQTIILPDSLFDDNVVTDEWKAQRGIRADAQCIRHSDYLKSIIEINGLIDQERFREGDDKILELQLLQKIHENEKALPGKLSDDEKSMLMRIPESGVLKSDVYKMVKSIKGDDYERKKEWTKFLGVKVEVSKAKTKNSGEAEDSKETLIRQQLETIALEIELEKMIVKCEEPIHEYLSLEEMRRLKQTGSTGDIGLRSQFNSERTERESKLNEYKKQLDDYMKKPENSMEKIKNSKSLDSIAESVQLLFEKVTQSNNQSPKAKA